MKLKRGNLGDIRSDCVYYMVFNEHKSFDDQDDNDRYDTNLIKKVYPEFIKYVSEPEKLIFKHFYLVKIKLMF